MNASLSMIGPSRHVQPLAEPLKTLEILTRRNSNQVLGWALRLAHRRLSPVDAMKLLSILDDLDLDVATATRLASERAPAELHCVRCHEDFYDREDAQLYSLRTTEGVWVLPLLQVAHSVRGAA